MKIVIVVGARPNFIKVSPLVEAINRHNMRSSQNRIEYLLVHTGQHYDFKMSQVFFEDLNLPAPHIHLGVGSGSHAEQTGKALIEVEKVLLKEKPDLVIVIGDINSTLAAALAAVKLNIPIAHIEAGLRVHDFSLPEEVNRQLTDSISKYLFTPFQAADENLKKEGIAENRIFFVGNIMADCLLSHREAASKRSVLTQLGLKKDGYAVLTLHRPGNVDNKETFSGMITAIQQVSKSIPVVYPVHPRTQKNIENFGMSDMFCWLDPKQDTAASRGRIHLVEPMGYLDFLQMEMNAKLVMTDSGGVQVETTMINVPCLSLLNFNIWPPTVDEGTNIIVGNNPEEIVAQVSRVLAKDHKKSGYPLLWDGKTGQRIIDILTNQTQA